MSVINTNFKSLITQNNLTVNNRNLSEAMEKLSTGKRINSASDDAAGLAISNKMTAQIRGLTQAVRNANDGISMVQTAEGALTEVNNMLQRMRELAVQAATDTNTSTDRLALDLEYQQLAREISRIATNTQWNAMNILNNTEVGVAGTSADVGEGVRNVKFQVGANPNQVINIGLKDFSYGVAVGTVPSESSFALGDLSGKQDFSLTIGSKNFSFSTTRAIAGSAMTEEELVDFETQLNKAVTDTSGFANVAITRVGSTIFVRDQEGRAIGHASGSSALQSFTTSTLRNEFVNGATAANALPARGTDIVGVQVSAGSQAGAVASETRFSIADLAGSQYFTFAMNGQSFNFQTTAAVSATDTSSMNDLVSKMSAAITGTAGYANVSVTRAGAFIHVRDPDGRDIVEATALRGWTDNARSLNLDTAVGTQLSAGLPPPASTSVFSGSARLNDTTLRTQANANLAISRLDNAMANVDQERATFGAVMNRLTYAGDNLTNVSQNTSFSRSRVLDTDYAMATTELARTQIIQQAGMAMLAQANQQPQTVLSLLQ